MASRTESRTLRRVRAWSHPTGDTLGATTSGRVRTTSLRLSIVTISFNQGKYLERAIQSVVQQRGSGPDIEYVVVDAGSTDSSTAILRKYRSEIDHLIEEPDDGPADGLNKGFALTTGDILGFLNADDWLEPRCLSTVGKFFSVPRDCGAVVGAIEILQDVATKKPHVRLPLPFTLERLVEGRTTTLQQGTFFTREAWGAIDGFNPSNLTCWDYELFADMLVAGVSFGRINEVLGGFRIHPDSVTGSGRNSEAYAADVSRIRSYALKTSAVPKHPMHSRVRRLAWRVRPLTRIREMQLGLERRFT